MNIELADLLEAYQIENHQLQDELKMYKIALKKSEAEAASLKAQLESKNTQINFQDNDDNA